MSQTSHTTAGGIAKYFVERRGVAWLFLVAVLIWGWVSYRQLPQKEDPTIPIRKALVVTAFTSRALAVGVAAATDTDSIGANTLLAVTAWLLIAYYGGIVFWHMVRDSPESGRS